jgi:hypothetical protein
MLNAREIQAFCLAPAIAPAVAIVHFGAMSQLLIIAMVSYVAAFVLGCPLYLAFRRRVWSLGLGLPLVQRSGPCWVPIWRERMGPNPPVNMEVPQAALGFRCGSPVNFYR